MTDLDCPQGCEMPEPASLPTLREELEQQFHACELVRPFRRAFHDPGSRLEYSLTGVVPAHTGRAILEVERFVGGGFAGQVYRVKVLDFIEESGPIVGLSKGGHYAIKILRPPSSAAKVFRDFLYYLAYQSPFSAQVNPAAVRVGVLWQKLIRRAAAIRLGDDQAVCDTFATFWDEDLSSFGEINEWVDGRIWKFEVDDRMFSRWKFQDQPPNNHNCPEYVHKKRFMQRLVALLHEMGAPELARQYEWWTMKSQPNALKRISGEGDPGRGMTAIDFRAGLTLLPFLPMSPVDPVLILRGLIRGRLVQFDRSVPARFQRFMGSHAEEFKDLQPAVDELKNQESIYRSSEPDVTHNHVRLLTSSKLRRSIREGTITGWKNLGLLDETHARGLRGRPGLFMLLFMISLVPFLGGFLIKVWGHALTRKHLKLCLTRFSYLLRALRGARIEALITWQRKGRVGDDRAMKLVHQPVRFWLHRILLGWLPPKWHRFLTDKSYAWSKIREKISFTLNFLRVPSFREEYLLQQLEMGRKEGMLTDSEAEKIASQIKDPYIQKYLRCLAVHICTVPVTQIVMVLAGAAVTGYCLIYRNLGWSESLGYGTVTGAAIQLMPISPGSIARGLFVLYLMIKERDIRNYYIAAPVSFLHVIGYLAFPLQMVTANPALSRFLAGRWTKQIVHIVPVFGERGGLLEHAIFDLFFNLPLSIKRGFKTHPVPWSMGTVIAGAGALLIAFLGYCRIWEWTRPEVCLDSVKVVSIESEDQPDKGFDWTSDGVRVYLEGTDGPIDYPAESWDGSIAVGDTIDAAIRKSFFGNGYDGLRITKKPLHVEPGNIPDASIPPQSVDPPEPPQDGNF